MKQFLSTTILLPLAVAGSLLIAQNNSQQPPPPERSQTPDRSQTRDRSQTPDRSQMPERSQTSERSRTQSEVKEIIGKIARSDGGKYVLIDSSGTTYQLDKQSAAKKFVGKEVKVSGTVASGSNEIHVTHIKAS